MDQVMQFVEPSRQFVKDSIRLVKRCTKPDRKGRHVSGRKIHLRREVKQLKFSVPQLLVIA
ncbi:hypothetical protein Nmel_000741 [Mimus melanotis]